MMPADGLKKKPVPLFLGCIVYYGSTVYYMSCLQKYDVHEAMNFPL